MAQAYFTVKLLNHFLSAYVFVLHPLTLQYTHYCQFTLFTLSYNTFFGTEGETGIV